MADIFKTNVNEISCESLNYIIMILNRQIEIQQNTSMPNHSDIKQCKEEIRKIQEVQASRILLGDGDEH